MSILSIQIIRANGKIHVFMYFEGNQCCYSMHQGQFYSGETAQRSFQKKSRDRTKRCKYKSVVPSVNYFLFIGPFNLCEILET